MLEGLQDDSKASWAEISVSGLATRPRRLRVIGRVIDGDDVVKALVARADPEEWPDNVGKIVKCGTL